MLVKLIKLLSFSFLHLFSGQFSSDQTQQPETIKSLSLCFDLELNQTDLLDLDSGELMKPGDLF